MKNALVIYNPLAGRYHAAGGAARIEILLRQAGYDCRSMECFDLQKAKLRSVALSHLRVKNSCVVVCGGDGTIRRVVSFLFEHRISIPVSIVPLGTSNDFARSLGIPGCDPLDALRSVSVLASGKTRLVDVGVARSGERAVSRTVYFMSTCAIGLFSNASHLTPVWLKKIIGRGGYVVVGALELLKNPSLPLTLTCDGKSAQGDFSLALFLNGRHGAGLSDLAPGARMDDGKLDMLELRHAPRRAVAAMFSKVMTGNPLASAYLTRRVVCSCTLAFADRRSHGVSVVIDGDPSLSLPVTVSVKRRALRLFVP